jgi:hypothetical protein
MTHLREALRNWLEKLLRDALAEELRSGFAGVNRTLEKFMAAIDDLTKAVQDMAAVDSAETDAINKAVAVIQAPGSTDAQVEAAAQAILASNKSRSDATATLVAALPAPKP